MKTIAKRLLSSFFISALLLPLLISCGDSGASAVPNGDVQTEPAMTDSESAETAAAETAAPAEYTDPDADYDGETYHFYSYQPQKNWTIAQFNGIVSPEGKETGEPVNDAIYTRTRTVEELLNIKITCATDVLGQTSGSVRNAVLAGDATYDAAIIAQTELAGLISQPGMFIDLNSIDGLDLTNSWWNQAANDEYTFLGRQYAAMGDICMYALMSCGTLYTNLQMIENLKLDDPYSLVRDGKWVIDKLDEMCRAASSDLNGNGAPDTEDRFGIGCSNTVAQHLMFGSGVRVTTKDKDGVSQFTLNDPKTPTVIDKAIRLLRDKNAALYQPDYTSKFSNVFNEFLLPAFLENRLLFNFNWINIAFEMRAMEADFALMPFPKYDEAQDRYYAVASLSWNTFLTVPGTSSRPDRIGTVLQAMGYYSQQIVRPAVVDNTVTTKTLRDEGSIEMLNLMIDSMIFDLFDLFSWGRMLDTINSCISGGSNDFASLYASKIGAAESARDASFELLGK